ETAAYAGAQKSSLRRAFLLLGSRSPHLPATTVHRRPLCEHVDRPTLGALGLHLAIAEHAVEDVVDALCWDVRALLRFPHYGRSRRPLRIGDQNVTHQLSPARILGRAIRRN